MDKIWKISLVAVFLFGIFNLLPKEERKTSGLKIAAAKDSSWELLREISRNNNLKTLELSETLMGDC